MGCWIPIASCEHLPQTTLCNKKHKYITPHDALRVYNVLTGPRSLCTHNKRPYCARTGDDTYAAMLKLLEMALSADTALEPKDGVEKHVNKHEDDLRAFSAKYPMG